MYDFVPGDYLGCNPTAEMTQSKKGDPMMIVTLDVFDNAGMACLEQQAAKVYILLTEKMWDLAKAKINLIGDFNGDFSDPEFSSGRWVRINCTVGERGALWDMTEASSQKAPPAQEVLFSLNSKWQTS